jgi:protein-S-isoprenylcysteine O-methyltransferase Ste14
MFHDRTLARAAAAADPCPRSAVSAGTGWAGLAGLLAWVAVCLHFGMDGPYAALVNVLACAVPMVLWTVLVDKAHRHPSTGFDWSHARPWRETREVSLTKLAGLWLTWGGIALVYAAGRFWWRDNFAFSMWVLTGLAPILFVLSIPYILILDRYATEPRDGCWALGAWAMGLPVEVDREAIFNHLRSWAVKMFFTAFMLAIVPPGFADFVATDTRTLLADPVKLAQWLITFMFVVDVGFATAGYLLALKPLDTHIRTANPFAAAWMAALICYPPFVLMADGGVLDYHPGTRGGDGWSIWLAGHPVLLGIVGATLVGLTAIYAWATMAFGLRFSNLTHRGILTHGPYRFTRHPAYLSKNLFWLISTLPFLTTGSWLDAVRACALMAATAGVYYWRAKTEERHLGLNPDYRAYSEWMERNGVIPRLFARIVGKRRDV